MSAPINNCAFTFDVPAGTSDLQFALGSQAAAGIADTLTEGSYYFIAAVGDTSNPQYVSVAVTSEQLSGMMSQGQTGQQGQSGQSGQTGQQGQAQPTATPRG